VIVGGGRGQKHSVRKWHSKFLILISDLEKIPCFLGVVEVYSIICPLFLELLSVIVLWCAGEYSSRKFVPYTIDSS